MENSEQIFAKPEDVKTPEQSVISELKRRMIANEILMEKNFIRKGNGSLIRKFPKIGRNEKCPCKSGKKYKICCGF